MRCMGLSGFWVLGSGLPLPNVGLNRKGVQIGSLCGFDLDLK